MRVKRNGPVEFTNRETGRMFMTDTSAITSVSMLEDGSTGLHYSGRDGYCPVKETYEEALNKVFPTLAEALMIEDEMRRTKSQVAAAIAKKILDMEKP